MNRISCFIFDLDGTLTRTNELIYATFNHVARKYLAREFTPVEITGMFGPPEEVAVERLVGQERRDEALRDFYEFYESHHPSMASAYDGIRECLVFLKERGCILAIFTGKGRRTALTTLREIGLADFFDAVITGSDVGNHKPSAEGINSVMKRFALEPGEVMMVGDAVADVLAARAAGVRVASVLWDSYAREKVLALGADEQFHSVSGFRSWLGLHFGIAG